MGLLSSIKDFGRRILRVVDNPVTRTVLGTAGLSQVGAVLSSAAGNQAATNAQLGAIYGAEYQAGTPSFNPQITGAPMLLGNSLFPSLPGVVQTPIQKAGNKLLNAVMSPTGMAIYPTGRRRRRMNPANIKAARRAIRRIRSTRRVLQRIERLLPTRTVHSRRK